MHSLVRFSWFVSLAALVPSASQAQAPQRDPAIEWRSFIDRFDNSRAPKIAPSTASTEEVEASKKRRAEWQRDRSDHLADFLRRFPKSRESSRARIEWARDTRPYDEKHAQSLLAKVIEIANDPAAVTEARYLLGMTYFRGEPAKARALLVEAADSPGDPEWRAQALVSLGELFTRDGPKTRAVESYRRVLSEYPSTRAAARAKRALGELDTTGMDRPACEVGKPFPDLAMTTLSKGLVSTASLRGRVILIDAFRADDPTWVAAFPALRALYEQLHSSGFEILGISLDSERSTLDAFASAQSIDWWLHWDASEKAAESRVSAKLGIGASPASLLIDRKGRLRHRSLSGRALLSAIEALASESP